ncbi:hypothetical protein CTI12_AA409950 [Artemisia annua]|uniref:SHSP domain-containing protein n=1 Tax=Artemisia annua TaxID=35608 RepID=A0A2U1M7P8_ARTAN|nr:hypothetical protein CTI12_AA409950 [Artemisia annua]
MYCHRHSRARWDSKPMEERKCYGWTETREAHVYKVEAKETDVVKVSPGRFGRRIQISVILKKDENADVMEPTQEYGYMTDLPQNANAVVYDTAFEKGVLSVIFPKVDIY